MEKVNSTWVWLLTAGVVAYFYFSGNASANPANGAGANNISSSGLSTIEGNESFSSTAYQDGSANGVQLYSIGYGHQIQPNEMYLMYQTISQAQAQTMLMADLQPIINAINNSGQILTQGQFDALSDFGMSGTGALQNALSSLLTNGIQSVPNVFQQYVYWHPIPGGAAQINNTLVTRRANETTTWNS